MSVRAFVVGASLASALLVTACGGVAGSATPSSFVRTPSSYVFDRCPLPADSRGYPLSVWSADSAVDGAWLADWARTAAWRWQVPSLRRNAFARFRDVSRRILPSVPRWSDDWKPAAGDVAEISITVSREGRIVGAPRVVTASGDAIFDRSIATIFDDPMPASPAFPAIPAASADTLRLTMRFGAEPPRDRSIGIVRFARHQSPVHVIPGTLQVYGSRSDFADVKYDVDAYGRAIAGTEQVLESSTIQFGRQVATALLSAQFRSAETDCEPIEMTVMQGFGR